MRISGVTFAARKTHKTRNTILTVIILLLILVLSIAIVSIYKGWGLIHPAKSDIEAFSSNIVPEYRDISFRGMDKNVLLKGWFFQTKNSDKTVILAHSYGKNRLEFGNRSIDMIKTFLDNGYNVFTFDLRYSGESGGKFTSFGNYEKDDISAAVDYVVQQGSKHTYIMGFSTGASASIMAAADNKKVEGIIADSPYSNLRSYLESSLNKWVGLPPFPFNQTILYSMEVISGADISNADTAEALKDLSPCRLMLIHGKGDKLISIENSRKLNSLYSEIAPGKSEIWETDDSGNATSYLENPEAYMNKVMEFLNKAPENR